MDLIDQLLIALAVVAALWALVHFEWVKLG
jgi:hypothetical protein